MPANPVMNATETEPIKDYQPYDMTGAQQQHPAPVVSKHIHIYVIVIDTSLPLGTLLILLNVFAIYTSVTAWIQLCQSLFYTCKFYYNKVKFCGTSSLQ